MTRSDDKVFAGEYKMNTLDKREYFAAMALQGFIASYAGAEADPDPKASGLKAVEYADALIEALNS